MKFGAPALAFLLSTVAFAQTDKSSPAPKKKPFRVASTHDQLVKQREAIATRNLNAQLKPVEAKEQAKASPPSSFLQQSDIICFNGVATLVPKRAILAIPPDYKSRLGMQPKARIVGWNEFLALNRGWVTTVEVDNAQAEGSKKLSESLSERIAKSTNLLVATYMGGPISVLPPKEEVAPKEEVPQDEKKSTKP